MDKDKNQLSIDFIAEQWVKLVMAHIESNKKQVKSNALEEGKEKDEK